jgi:fermentation-respiration switch protein FrsA (DUF1100 family)
LIRQVSLRSIAAVGIGAIVFLYAWQSRLVYYPSAELRASPADAGLAYEDLLLSTEDGERLHGWYVPHPRPRGTLLFLHGNAGNIGDRLESVSIFHRLGLDVAIIDYRGYGRSSGSPSERGTALDAEAAWHYLRARRGMPARRIVVFGRSLGGAVAVRLAVSHPPAALIVESTFTSLADMASEIYPFLPVRWLLRFEYDSLERIAALRCPLMVIHSVEDDLVPFEQGRRLYAAAPVPKRFLELRGDHNSGFFLAGPRYGLAVDEFLTEVAGLPQVGADADSR